MNEFVFHLAKLSRMLLFLISPPFVSYLEYIILFDLRRCSMSYMNRRLLTSFAGAAGWSGKLRHTEYTGSIQLELFQSCQLYHTKQSKFCKYHGREFFSLEPVWIISCLSASAGLLTVSMTPWWFYLGDSNLLKTVIVVWGIVSPLNLNS